MSFTNGTDTHFVHSIFDNCTEQPAVYSPSPFADKRLRYIAATGVTVFSCTGVLVNFIFIYAITRTKYVPRITKHFLTCVALGDLVSAIFASGFAIYPSILEQPPASGEAVTSYPPGPKAMCKLQAWVLSFTDAVTSYNMMFLSCDRYIAATQPVQYPQIMTSRQSVVTIIANCLVIAGFHIPAFQEPMWRYVPHASMCVPSFWYNWPYVVADWMIFVVIPGVIYLWAYVKLTDKVSKPLFDNPQHVNSDTALDQDLIQVIGFLGICFYVSILPYQLYVLIMALSPTDGGSFHNHNSSLYSNVAIAALVWFSLIKTIICPIYACYKYKKFHKKLRKMFLRLLTCGLKEEEDEERRLQVVVSMIRRKATTGSIRVRRNSNNGPIFTTSPQRHSPNSNSQPRQHPNCVTPSRVNTSIQENGSEQATMGLASHVGNSQNATPVHLRPQRDQNRVFAKNPRQITLQNGKIASPSSLRASIIMFNRRKANSGKTTQNDENSDHISIASASPSKESPIQKTPTYQLVQRLSRRDFFRNSRSADDNSSNSGGADSGAERIYITETSNNLSVTQPGFQDNSKWNENTVDENDDREVSMKFYMDQNLNKSTSSIVNITTQI